MGFTKINKIDKETGEITGAMSLEIRAYPFPEPKGKTKDFASVSIDGVFGVHGISVIEGKNGLFVSMPQTKDAKGEYRGTFHPVTSDGRRILNNAALSEYAAALDALVTEKEPTLAKLREGANAAKERPAPEKSEAAIEAGNIGKKKSSEVDL